MATHEEVEQKLLEAIHANAEMACGQSGPSVKSTVAAAARDLAEALAWMRNPAQPH